MDMTYIYENAELLTRILVSWVPTVVFVLGVLIGTMVGIKRGARKSIILFIHSMAIFALCITLFVLLVSVEEVDVFLLQITNTILGSDTALQDMLGVSIECETLKEVLLQLVLTLAEKTGDVSIIFKDNGEYILTLIDLVYRLAFALVLYVLYFILIFILYLIHIIFYPVRRYKKKVNKQFYDGLAETPYRKGRLAGGIIGFIRSLVGGLVNLSFVGTLLFILAGGLGEKEYEDYDFGDDNKNLIYDVYTSVAEYGNEGIFKVLNTVKDKNETPYYLFAADLIFQGGLEDLENGINQDIYFRKEIGTFIGFARDTIDLLLKYDDKHIVSKLISGNFEGDIMDEVLEIMSNPHFQSEFTMLISTFDAETYVINLGLSFVNSYVANLDDIMPSSGNNAGAEILKILFKKGYLCEDIPYEKALLEEKENNPSSNESRYNLAHISANKLIKQSDVTNIVNALFNVIQIMGDRSFDEVLQDTDLVVVMVRSLIPYIKNLSILSTEREAEFNPILKRLYSYLEYTVLSVDEDKTTYDLARNTRMYEDESLNSISWIREINTLLDVVDDGLVLFQNLDLNLEKLPEPLEIVRNMFDDESHYYNDNMKLLDGIIYEIGSSQIVGEVLSTKLVFGSIEEMLSEFTATSLPQNISYANKFDSNGNIVEHGEVYNVLCAIRALADNPDSYTFIESFADKSDDLYGLINEALDTLNASQFNGKSTLDYLIDSTLIRSILSGVLMSSEEMSGMKFYVDDCALDQTLLLDGYKVLSKEEVQIFFDIAPEFLEVIQSFMEEGTSFEYVEVLNQEVNIKSQVQTIGNVLWNGETVKLKITSQNSLLYPGQLAFVVGDNNLLINNNNVYNKDGNLIDPYSNYTNELILELDLINSGLTATGESLEIYFYAESDDILSVEVLLEKEVEAEPIDKFMDLLNGDKVTKILKSKLVEGTISTLMISYIPQDQIVMPKEMVLVSTKEADSELKKIINLISSDIIDISKLFNEDYMGLIKDLDEEKLSKVLESSIFHYTLSSFICGGQLDDIFTIVVPNTSTIKLNNDSIDYLIEKENLVAFINNVIEIMPENTDDTEKININELLGKVIKNRNQYLNDQILLATLSHYLATNDILEGTLVITNNLKVAGSKENLERNFRRSPWNGELVALLDALDELLEISNDDFNLEEMDVLDEILPKFKTLNDKCVIVDSDKTKLELCYESEIFTGTISHHLDSIFEGLVSNPSILAGCKEKGSEVYTFENLQALVDAVIVFDLDFESKDEDGNINVDTSAIVDSVLEDLPTYNIPNPDNRDGVSDLELIYGSAIIRDIFSTQIDSVLVGDNEDGIIKKTDATNYLKDKYNAYKIEEVNALIELLNIFDITGSDLNDSTGDSESSLFDKIIDNIQIINEKDNLDKLYKANIFGVLMTNQIEKNVTIPKDALEGLKTNSKIEKRKLVKEEVRYLVDSIDILDVDLTNFNVTEIELTDELIEAIAPSKVISAIMYKNISSSGDIVIPATTLSSSLDYIVEEEFRLLLDCLKEEMDSFFEKSKTNPSKYDISSVKPIDIDDVDTNMIRDFTKSDILEATMIHTLVENSSDTITLPSMYKSHATVNVLTTQKNNVWLANNEIVKIADALDVLGLQNLNVDNDSITSVFTYNNMNTKYGQTNRTKLEIIMDSAIMSATMSNTIVDTLGKDMISSRVMKHNSIYNSSRESYTIEEINNLLYGVNNVLEIDDFNKVDATIVYDKIKADNDLLDEIWSSRLLSGIISYKIYESSVIKHHKNAYEADIEIYRVVEIKTLFKMLGEKDINDISLDDISLDSIKEAIKLKADGTVDSYLLLRTLSHKLLNTSDIVIPNECIDEASGSNKYLYPNDLVDLIDAMQALDITNANVDFESIGTQKDRSQYEKAFESDIIRASITKMIKIDSSDVNFEILLGVEKDKNLIEITKDVSNKDISILSSDELLDIIDGFNALTGGSDSYEWEFDIEKIIGVYNDGKLDTILKSSLFYVVISKNLTELYVKIEQMTQMPIIGASIPELPIVTINNTNVINIDTPHKYNSEHEYDQINLIIHENVTSFVDYLNLHWSNISSL